MVKEKYTLTDIAKVRKNYKIFDYLIYTRISQYITLPLLYTKITPNQVTILSLISAVISSIFFVQGNYVNVVFGVIFLQLAHIFDAVDGELARVKKMTSKFGGFFDGAINHVTYYLTIPAMAIGHFSTNKDPSVLIFAIFALANIFLISGLKFMFKADVPRKEAGHQIHLGKGLIIGGFSTHVFILGLGALLNQIYYTLLFLAVAGALVWIRQFYSYYKLCKN
ncbi:MAG: CDP-alcohol phosphatidyltransferase family protein [Nanoarchaeota archaeon]